MEMAEGRAVLIGCAVNPGPLLHRALVPGSAVYGPVGATLEASHGGRRIEAIVALRSASSEIFTTSPVRGAWTYLPPPMYMPTWWTCPASQKIMSPGWICDRLTLVPRVFHIPDVVPRPEKSV